MLLCSVCDYDCDTFTHEIHKNLTEELAWMFEQISAQIYHNLECYIATWRFLLALRFFA